MLGACCSISLLWCRFVHLHWTHTVKYSRGMPKCLLDIFFGMCGVVGVKLPIQLYVIARIHLKPSCSVGFICIPGQLWFCFFRYCHYCAVLWCAQIIMYIMARCCIRLFGYYTTSLSSFCTQIWRYWTYDNMLVKYILSSVCLRLSQYFQFSIMK